MKLVNEQELVISSYKTKPLYSWIKQMIDTLLCLYALVALFPLFLLVSVLIKFDSPGSIFYRQERIGLNGKAFQVIKFRTMRADAEKNGPQWADQNDSRITRVGHYLRKYRLDELPQLINVVLGDMSLIGPRPERLVFIEEFEKDLPHFRNRLQVKPGITGWAQINGGYELTPKEKLGLDLYYINHFSVLLDLKIAMKSVPVILFAKGWR
ncbi:exopolysaccharide biosynthesis polyprenyl glycosylphosphotransferase [Neobacillus sp. PS2-9]|uniref:sugar transferase n=1 Tax=Neobacillus sp. PS2-9 TaxID=3070676 RepID=UPI0027E07667|nr:exopolysaccharide biosynthesis polyprenyl glycosylphosphotransferase [Neobacillus sp. PS2-9]WML58590.1 exopolysaccharide biosynthesis polyprenyl glycosylphosphotransferase [Neobacillus sp. PS2-9]